MKVDLVDWPAKPKLSMVPLLKLYSESLLTPLLSFCLFERMVFGVALLFILEFVLLLNGFAAVALPSLSPAYSFFSPSLLF